MEPINEATPKRLMKQTKKQLVDIIMTNDDVRNNLINENESYKQQVERLNTTITGCKSRIDKLEESIKAKRLDIEEIEEKLAIITAEHNTLQQVHAKNKVILVVQTAIIAALIATIAFILAF